MTPPRSSVSTITSAWIMLRPRQATPLWRKRPCRRNSLPPPPSRTETIQTEQGAVEFEMGGFKDNIEPSSASIPEEGSNFTSGREKKVGEPAVKRNLSGPSSTNNGSSPGLTSREGSEQKPSVKKQLQEIKQEQTEKKASKSKQHERQHPSPGHSRQKKKRKQKGR